MGLGRRRKAVTRGDDLTPIVVTITAVTTCSRCEMTRTSTSAVSVMDSVQDGAAPASDHCGQTEVLVTLITLAVHTDCTLT